MQTCSLAILLAFVISTRPDESNAADTDYAEMLAATREVSINFATVDRKLNSLLGVVQGLQSEIPSVNLVCNRLRVAEHNLYFAVFAGDDTPNRNLEVLLRQTMAQNTLVGRLNPTAG